MEAEVKRLNLFNIEMAEEVELRERERSVSTALLREELMVAETDVAALQRTCRLQRLGAKGLTAFYLFRTQVAALHLQNVRPHLFLLCTLAFSPCLKQAHVS